MTKPKFVTIATAQVDRAASPRGCVVIELLDRHLTAAKDDLLLAH
jgi:hypothetical protein